MQSNTLLRTTLQYLLLAGCLHSGNALSEVQTTPANLSSRVTEKPLTLDIHFHYHKRKGSVYNNDWPVEKRASELTGISLNNVTPIDIVNGNEAFNLMIASGDLPDIVGGTKLREKFNQYGPLGHFLPLNDLISKHAPNIHAYFESNQDLLKAVSAADGNLYHIPYVPDGKFGRAYFIRTDWLDKLGLDVPHTVEDLYKVLTAFKQRDPNGNGTNDETPFFARNFEEMVRLVTLWDARTTGSDTWHDFYISDDDTVRHGYIEENYKKGITHLAKWYSEGLIDDNVFNADDDIRIQMLSSNTGGMTHDWFASTASFNERLATQIKGFEFKPIPPPESVSGRRLEEHRRAGVKPDGWAITKTNRAVIETIKYFDFWFTPQGRRLANFGREGHEYTIIEGRPVFYDKVLNGDIPVNTKLWSIGAQVPRGFLQDYAYEKQWTNQIALEGIKLYEQGDYLIEPFYGITLSVDEKDTVDFYWHAILQFMLERQEEWILGTRNVNKDWASYLVQLNKLGIKKVLTVMQTAYDRQYSSTGS